MRFLEVMPVGPLAHLHDRHLVPAAEIIERLSARFELRRISSPHGQPATDYAARARDAHGVIGVIASTTRPFCSSCQRIRITSRGQLLTYNLPVPLPPRAVTSIGTSGSSAVSAGTSTHTTASPRCR